MRLFDSANIPESTRARVAIFAWLFVLFGLVLVLSMQIVLRLLGAQDSANDADSFARALEELPTDPIFFVALALAIALYLAMRSWRYYLLLTETRRLREVTGDRLAEQDWWTAQDLRVRAFRLRTRAGLMLGSVWVLLFVGMYLSLYVLPVIVGGDPARLLKAQFEGRFGATLDSLASGLHWVQVDDNLVPPSIRDPSSFNFQFRINNLTLLTVDSGENWSQSQLSLGRPEGILAAAFSTDGRTGIVVGDRRSLFRTSDGGESWGTVDFSLGESEWILAAAFGTDGRIGFLVGDEGSVLRTIDSGESWLSVGTFSDVTGTIHAVALSADGQIGLVVGTEGSVVLTADSGRTWRRVNFPLNATELIRAVALSTDGTVGIVVGDEGSVVRTSNGGETWSGYSLILGAEEGIRSVHFSRDGQIGLVEGNEGSILHTSDGGESWVKVDLSLGNTEWIRSLALSLDAQVGMLVGDEGSVLRTLDGGTTWTPVNLSLGATEWIHAASLSADGTTAILVGDEGSIFRSTNAGITWEPVELSLEAVIGNRGAAFSADGRIGVVSYDERAVFRTLDGGQSWAPADFSFENYEEIRTLAFSADGRIGIVVGDQGSVFRTSDSGTSSDQLDLTLKTNELVSAVAVSADGNDGIIGGDEGSILKSADSGATWTPLQSPLREREGIRALALSANSRVWILVGDEGLSYRSIDRGRSWVLTSFVPEQIARIVAPALSNETKSGEIELRDSQTSGRKSPRGGAAARNPGAQGIFFDWTMYALGGAGNIYALRSYEELRQWRDFSPQEVQRIVEGNNFLAESEVLQDIQRFVRDASGNTQEGTQRTGNEISGNGGSTESLLGLEQITVTRIAVLTILFFLVRILVRVYQYNLRLAAFWKSRADAVYLAQNFSDIKGKAIGFDDLVFSLAPDSQDFRGPPKSPFDWFRFRKQS